MVLHVLLLLADEAPGLVKLQTGDLQPSHAGVVQTMAGILDAFAEAHDRVAMDFG